MSKDIKLAVIHEYNKDFRTYDWNVYLVNSGTDKIEMVLILSNGYDEKRSTSVMRHKITVLPGQSVAKIEYLHDDVLQLNNTFKITYFLGTKLFEKEFFIKSNTLINEKAQKLDLFSGNKGFLFE